MKTTTLRLHTGFQIAEVDARIFGGFLEHMGRAVYEGVYEPGSVHADDAGWRKDVLEALRGLNMTAMRYPGGNFVSGYHWQDGIGPPESRPRLREFAWNSVETNRVGTDEFVSLARRMGWQPMLAVNLGTGTPEEARNWVEYCNSPAGTRYADMRAEAGSPEPHGVKLWCLGNEMDGPWQIGHVPAEQYGWRAQQAAKLMKDADRSIELVVSGSSHPLLPTYLEWDRTALEIVGELADYLSAHRYVGAPRGDTADFLAVGNAIDRQIEEADAVCRFVQGKRKSAKRAYVCFDEWNVWYRTFGKLEHMDGGGRQAPHLIEEIYSLEDALVVAGILHSFVRHADAVKVANLAQIVNVIAPLVTRGDGLLVQTIYWPFAMFSKRRRGVSLRTAVEGPGYESPSYGRVDDVDASAILDGARLSVFLSNRAANESEVAIDVANRSVAGLEDAELLTGPSAETCNTFEEPNVVRSEPFEDVAIQGGGARAKLPPLSFLAMTLRLG
jgi:alpha-N-arabinofuranosidase